MNTIRDSFDDRFGDDLFEEILSYLPIKDKYKYESVSKRFQRLIFNKQRVLRIGHSSGFADNVSIYHLIDTEYGGFGRHFNDGFLQRIDLSKLSKLIKKFPLIIEIRFNYRLENMSNVLNEITNNCRFLSAICFDGEMRSLTTMGSFAKKFGSNLRHISFYRSLGDKEVVKQLLQFTPNLRSISYPTLEVMNNEFLSEKLVKIDSFYVKEEELRFSDKMSLNLKYLDINTKTNSKSNKYLIEEFSKLKNLVVLKVGEHNENLPLDIWSKTIESIATHSRDLQFFRFCKYGNDFGLKDLLEGISHFSELKRLEVIAKSRTHTSSKSKNLSDLMALKKCKNLLSLQLKYDSIDDKTFDGIHLIVPQLRQLSFESRLIITDNALESIEKLKYLTHLEISGYIGVNISVNAIKSLINVCERLKSLRIYSIQFKDNLEEYKQLMEEHNHNIEIILS